MKLTNPKESSRIKDSAGSCWLVPSTLGQKVIDDLVLIFRNPHLIILLQIVPQLSYLSAE